MFGMISHPESSKARLLIGGALALAIAFGGGFLIGGAGIVPVAGAEGAGEAPPENVDFTPLYRAWHLLEENFATATTSETVSAEERVWGAVQGLAQSYGDDYTVFFPPEEKEFFESEVRGDFQGVGMEIGVRDGVLTVIAPLKDTPAYRAGIESGDSILEIDGESTAGLSTESAVRKIRGERGTSVTFTLSRGGAQPFQVTVVRDTITLPTIDTELREDGVFVLRLYGFNAAAPQLFRSAIREFAESGTDKLVIDLRGNPGGFLEVSVELASWFLPAGKTIVIEDYSDDTADVAHRSYGYDVFTDSLKLALLIDGGSASASEIFAGALGQHGKATLIGETSFGKGSVQQVFPVTDATSLKITVAHWLTPNGSSISSGGITPDIEVAMTAEDREAGKDPQLERAARFLLTGE